MVGVNMSKRMHILCTDKHLPLLKEVEEIAKLQPKKNKLTATLMEMVELGLHFYKGGYRIVDSQLVRIQKENIL